MGTGFRKKMRVKKSTPEIGKGPVLKARAFETELECEIRLSLI
ncbi:hypothetical protein CEV31_1545 [Brucella thiophenivorans]|uniref:Uncharacterized protein n=1 Tax=Brucella thiophenivorans TaxID=571255 RepID=A0A256FZ85_9HYPH|nr:hypothetical protein CEV31_1545 [Brucella thiophenivorans]